MTRLVRYVELPGSAIFGFARNVDSRYRHRMDQQDEGKNVSWGARLALGVKVFFDTALAKRVAQCLKAGEAKAQAPAPERAHASGLLLLSALQREGRLLDFLQQDVADFSDEQVGAAARVVHSGCRRTLQQYFDFEPAAKEGEGSEVTLPKGFDAQRWRLTGNVAGQPPFRGTLRHHGWVARQIRMPVLSDAIDPRIVAPAELELA